LLAKAIDGVKFSRYDVLVGKSLKDEFNLAVDDKLIYIFTSVEPGGLSVTPKIKRFKVRSVFDSGLSAYDKAYSYTTMESLRRVLHMPANQYDGIHIFSKNPREDMKRIKQSLPVTVVIKGWWQDNVNFFAALEMEKTSLFIVLMLIILIASINIISSLLMTVMNRRGEIALLLSLGTTKAEVKKVFLYLVLLLVLVGL